MYTKTIIITERSYGNKNYTCKRTMPVMDEEEMALRELERAERRYAEIKAYKERQRMLEEQKYYESLRPTSMRRIMDAYEEYLECERYY